jgi:hypothetical protein
MPALLRLNGTAAEVFYDGAWTQIGCRAGGCVRGCAGGWPGTLTGRQMAEAAIAGTLKPWRLKCATAEEYGRMAVAVLSRKD